MNPFIANVTAYRLVISCNCLLADSIWELLHIISMLYGQKSDKQNPTKKRFLTRDNNTTTRKYKPKYRTFNTNIPNNKPNKII